MQMADTNKTVKVSFKFISKCLPDSIKLSDYNAKPSYCDLSFSRFRDSNITALHSQLRLGDA